jgi:hypothetical protein
MRPRKLNSDSSAIRSTLSQRGHFGRPKFRVAATSVLQASSQFIVDLLDADYPHPVLPLDDNSAGGMWRRRDAIMKL